MTEMPMPVQFDVHTLKVVLAELPLVVNPLALAGRPYTENYRWKPEPGTRFTLIDRASGVAVGGLETEACSAFHHVNAYIPFGFHGQFAQERAGS
jgi:carotenoid cleavage dioxygenase-like enzyme